MPKVKVIKKYVDKHTKKMCNVDEVLDYTEERAKELVADKRVVIINEEAEAAKPAKKKEDKDK